MPVPTGQASLFDIQTEFGGVNPIGINEYYSIVAGIPASGEISINNFRGKSKVVVSYPPPAVQTNYGSYGLPWPVANTSLEWIAGASGTNLTRSGGSTFNNLGADNYAGRPNFINYQSLILQARPGDTIQFQIRNGAISGGDYEINSVLLNLGGGYFNIGSVGGYGSHTDTINYTIPAGQALGNYAIAVYNNYSNAANGSYASANFYSLHIC